MKTKRRDICITLLFALFLAGMFTAFVLLPKRDFSVLEKRTLAAAPKLTAQSLFSGAFSDRAETWAAEHLPGRDTLVGLNALIEFASGRQVTREILRGRDGRLFEAPAVFDAAELRRRLDILGEFAETADRDLTLMLVPSAGAMLPEELPALHDPWADGEILDAAAAAAGGRVHLLDLREAFAQTDTASLYYRTDHHWTSRGAWLAAAVYGEESGRPAPAEERYTVTRIPGFFGTTYARAAFWGLPPEELELWDSGASFTAENLDSPGEHEGLFYPEHLGEPDKYPVYLDGNHSLVRIRRAGGEADGRLLVIRDSFANCLGCFLADSWGETVLVDLRYYRGAVSELLETEDFDAVLVVYGLNNFLTDGNLGKLE